MASISCDTATAIFVLFSVYQYGLAQNIALNKPASVAALDSGSGPLNYGNDGLNVNSDPCVVTDSGPQPYWSVDLEGIYKLDSIDVHARQDIPFGPCTGTCTQRMSNLEVRMGFSKTPTENELCTFYGGTVPFGGSASISCTETQACGRYLTVQRVGSPIGEPLNFCEIKAFASAAPVRTQSLLGNNKQKDMKLLGHMVFTQEVISRIECLRLCLNNQYDCKSVNIYPSGGKLHCDVNGSSTEDGITLSPFPGSTYYSIAKSHCG